MYLKLNINLFYDTYMTPSRVKDVSYNILVDISVWLHIFIGC